MTKQKQQQHVIVSDEAIASRFPYVLPPPRLGQRLPSLEAFEAACKGHTTSTTKEYTLVVVTESSRQRILLGTKHRGFGAGMNNSFGGKLHNDETMVQCACRELHEETGIAIPTTHMAQCLVGAMHFTFEDQDVEMIVRVYHVDVVTCKDKNNGNDNNKNDNDASASIPNTNTNPFPIDPSVIRGCEEITPEWFDHWFNIPLDNMFADDSLWITRLLLASSEGQPLNIDGWFHFHPGGQDVNSIRHYYMNIRPKRKTKKSSEESSNNQQSTSTTIEEQPFTLEKRLFHALHNNRVHSPSIKEFKEAFAFCNAVKSNFHKKQQQPFQVVIDVAGGHGALAALLLITTSATRGVVIDPAQVGNGGVERAWGTDFLQDKQLEYRHEDLRTGLPSELERTLLETDPDQVLVVACHACQHLSEEIVDIVCTRFRGVSLAVLPCCQNDVTGSWKSASKNLQVPIAKVMDLLLAGKAMSLPFRSTECPKDGGVLYNYDVRMKLIDEKITPQNRIILCRAVPQEQGRNTTGTPMSPRKQKLESAHQKLAKTYTRAHRVQGNQLLSTTSADTGNAQTVASYPYHVGGACLAIGFLAGIVVTNATRKRS